MTSLVGGVPSLPERCDTATLARPFRCFAAEAASSGEISIASTRPSAPTRWAMIAVWYPLAADMQHALARPRPRRDGIEAAGMQTGLAVVDAVLGLKRDKDVLIEMHRIGAGRFDVAVGHADPPWSGRQYSPRGRWSRTPCGSSHRAPRPWPSRNPHGNDGPGRSSPCSNPGGAPRGAPPRYRPARRRADRAATLGTARPGFRSTRASTRAAG